MTKKIDVDDPTMTFDSDLGLAKSLRNDIKFKQEALRVIDQRVMQALFSRGEVGHKQPDGSWSIQTKVSKTIDKGALVAAGVSIDIIEAATKESISSPFLVWREKKEKAEAADAAPDA
jgi:hypothetical protein